MSELHASTAASDQRFEHLPRAPIVEAVIQLRSRAENMPALDLLKANLQRDLPDYPEVKKMGAMTWNVAVSGATGGDHSQQSIDSQQEWLGLRAENGDGRQVAMFTRDFFSFSRLKPYENWSSFTNEALRLWHVHERLLNPTEIGRIGVRFINRFKVPVAGLEPRDYLTGLPTLGDDLRRTGFLYRDELISPDRQYAMTVMRTIQADPESPTERALLLDIDVYSVESFPSDLTKIEKRLGEIQILKDQIFFENVTEKSLEMCR